MRWCSTGSTRAQARSSDRPCIAPRRLPTRTWSSSPRASTAEFCATWCAAAGSCGPSTTKESSSPTGRCSPSCTQLRCRAEPCSGRRPVAASNGSAAVAMPGQVEIEADRDGLERLCRYLARPPIATERLSLAPDGRVIYALRRHCKDGTRAFVFDPLDFIARLAALVPRPRAHLLTHHSVLAPAAEGRDWIVPGVGRSARRELFQSLAGLALRPQRSKWAELLKRLFEIDALIRPYCGGQRKLRSAADRRPDRAQDPRAPGAPDLATCPRSGTGSAPAYARLVTADPPKPARTHLRECRDGRSMP